jgi:crotonobetainyl-CoA:carnitine CoA-transferase CaiB-like acyl-CoA transferase
MAPHETYKAAGDADKWVSIAVGTESEWRALCSAMEKPNLSDDPRFSSSEARKRNEKELDRIITEWTSGRDRWAITRALQEARVAAFPSMSNKDLATDEHLRARGFLVALNHPEVGWRTHVGAPWRIQNRDSLLGTPAPLRGADTDLVLTDLLGYSTDRIAQLRESGVLI